MTKKNPMRGREESSLQVRGRERLGLETRPKRDACEEEAGVEQRGWERERGWDEWGEALAVSEVDRLEEGHGGGWEEGLRVGLSQASSEEEGLQEEGHGEGEARQVMSRMEEGENHRHRGRL